MEEQKRFTISMRWDGERYEATIPEINATAFGTTRDEALHHAELAIVSYNLASLPDRELPEEEEDDDILDGILEDVVEKLNRKLGFDLRELGAVLEWWQSFMKE